MDKVPSLTTGFVWTTFIVSYRDATRAYLSCFYVIVNIIGCKPQERGGAFKPCYAF